MIRSIAPIVIAIVALVCFSSLIMIVSRLFVETFPHGENCRKWLYLLKLRKRFHTPVERFFDVSRCICWTYENPSTKTFPRPYFRRLLTRMYFIYITIHIYTHYTTNSPYCWDQRPPWKGFRGKVCVSGCKCWTYVKQLFHALRKGFHKWLCLLNLRRFLICGRVLFD